MRLNTHTSYIAAVDPALGKGRTPLILKAWGTGRSYRNTLIRTMSTIYSKQSSKGVRLEFTGPLILKNVICSRRTRIQ